MVCGQCSRMDKGFLKNRSLRVKVGKKYSSNARVMSGIPQGSKTSILGPIPFTVFIYMICRNH